MKLRRNGKIDKRCREWKKIEEGQRRVNLSMKRAIFGIDFDPWKYATPTPPPVEVPDYIQHLLTRPNDLFI